MQDTESEHIRRIESRFEGCNGDSLFRRSWVPGEARGAIMLVHGFAEHSGRYEDFGKWFAKRGVAVHGFDHRGHGRSPGKRNFVGNFDEFLDDLAAFEAVVRCDSNALPIVIVGHSMGGLISAAYARERKPKVQGLALSGPALLAPDAFSVFQRWMLRVLGAVASGVTVQSAVVPEALSRDPEVGRRYVEDPLVDTRMTAGLATAMIGAAARTQGRAAEIELPLLLQHGAEDPLCPVSCSERFMASRANTSPPSEIHIYPELRHEIFNEPERELVLGDLHAWLMRACGHGGSAE